MKQGEMFHFCKYWGTWSRLLTYRDPNGPYVEVNLTPIPACGASSWEKDVIPIRIRKHGTKLDNTTKVLPEAILFQIMNNIGEELTNRLLEEDFLSQIDWGKYVYPVRNGGANLADILK